uniref:RING-type domain-containing protein n=1 Tax=Leersia perrieri TaxID=77586 RepID=A0A0D9VKK4_9ORYZ
MAAGATLSVLLLVAGVVLMLVLHVVVVFWALRRGVFLRGAFEVEEREGQQGAGLTPDEIAGLPCHERKEVGGGGGECPVCLEAFQAGDRCRVLPRCEHGFHARCVEPWLRQSRVCPICRAEVVAGDGGKAATAGSVAEGTTLEIIRRCRTLAFGSIYWGSKGAHSVVFLVTGLSLVVLVHIFVVLWALWWGFYLSRLARVGQIAEERAEVSELPCHDVKEDAGAGECAVCLEAFRPGDRRRVLPGCEHGFHAQCVDSWLRKSRLCPICRAEVAADAGHSKEAESTAAEAATLEIVTER